jgi:beta-mannanase
VHDPQTYVAAWQRIHTIFEQEGATNVGWVWCPMARGFTTSKAAAYYPGDDQVNWLCADVYAGANNEPFSAVSAAFRTWAASIHKPIMIGELGAQQPGTQTRQTWWTAALHTVAGWPQVKAVVLFESRGSREDPFDLALAGDPALLATVRALVTSPPFAP